MQFSWILCWTELVDWVLNWPDGKTGWWFAVLETKTTWLPYWLRAGGTIKEKILAPRHLQLSVCLSVWHEKCYKSNYRTALAMVPWTHKLKLLPNIISRRENKYWNISLKISWLFLPDKYWPGSVSGHCCHCLRYTDQCQTRSCSSHFVSSCLQTEI